MRKFTFLPVILVLFAMRQDGDACCSAYRIGGPAVNIARQEILVSWDPATRVEHFVRRATFEGGPAMKDFGFLVPTPSKPELAEADNAVFDRLWKAIQPEVKNVTENDYHFSLLWALMPALGARSDSLPPTARQAGVNVLETRRVAGYDATILEAFDAAALTDWLGANGYAARPEITDWVAPYVEKRWKVTAFKYAAPEAGPAGGVGTPALRMTFTTDRPLFPYRVPSDQRDGRDTLRVYYVGKERAEGTLGDAGSAWKKDLKFSNRVPALNGLLSGAAEGSGDWLTAFEDHRWPGGSEDLYFAPSADPSPVLPPPIINWKARPILIPLDLIIPALIIAGLAWRRRATR